MQSHENSSELLSKILSQVELHHDRCFGTLWNPTPQKISSYAFIAYYTKYLIFILSHLLNLNNLCFGCATHCIGSDSYGAGTRV